MLRNVWDYLCEHVGILSWAELIIPAIAFAAVGVNTVKPDLGIPSLRFLVGISIFMGVLMGLIGHSGSRRFMELTSGERWLARLANFLFYAGEFLIGGWIGLLIFR